MNQNIEIALKQAFNLIEADQLDEARAILRPILESEKDNPDVWWVYAHAVTSAETAHLALNNVLRLDPTYPGANDLFAQLQTQTGIDDLDPLGELGGEPSFVPALPTSIPGIAPLPKIRPISPQNNEDQDEFPDDDFESESEEAFYRRPLFYVPLISLLVIVALAIVIFKPFSVSSPTLPTSTDVTSEAVSNLTPTFEIAMNVTTTSDIVIDLPPTSDNSVTSEILDATPTTDTLVPNATSTTEGVVIDPTTVSGDSQTAGDFGDVKQALASFNLPAENAISISPTSLGQTLIADVCTTAGREMRVLLPQVTSALAMASQPYSNTIQAVAVRMTDCAATTTLLQVGLPIADAKGFASGSIAEANFQALWKPI